MVKTLKGKEIVVLKEAVKKKKKEAVKISQLCATKMQDHVSAPLRYNVGVSAR